jgi:hypothetical protein
MTLRHPPNTFVVRQRRRDALTAQLELLSPKIYADELPTAASSQKRDKVAESPFDHDMCGITSSHRFAPMSRTVTTTEYSKTLAQR